jgi:hypothetical protein
MSLEFPNDDYNDFEEFYQPLKFPVIEVIGVLTAKLKQSSFIVSLVNTEDGLPKIYNEQIEFIKFIGNDELVISVCTDYETERLKLAGKSIQTNPKIFIEVSLAGVTNNDVQSDCYKLCEYIIRFLENNPDQVFHNKVKNFFGKKIEWIGGLQGSIRHGYRIHCELTKY